MVPIMYGQCSPFPILSRLVSFKRCDDSHLHMYLLMKQLPTQTITTTDNNKNNAKKPFLVVGGYTKDCKSNHNPFHRPKISERTVNEGTKQQTNEWIDLAISSTSDSFIHSFIECAFEVKNQSMEKANGTKRIKVHGFSSQLTQPVD